MENTRKYTLNFDREGNLTVHDLGGCLILAIGQLLVPHGMEYLTGEALYSEFELNHADFLEIVNNVTEVIL